MQSWNNNHRLYPFVGFEGQHGNPYVLFTTELFEEGFKGRVQAFCPIGEKGFKKGGRSYSKGSFANAI